MKVAIITSGFLPVVDGVTVSGFYRLQKLSQWGHQVLIFCPDYSSLEGVYPNWRDYTGNILPGVNVINLESTPFMDLDFERNVSSQAYKTVLQALEKFQPNIIHVDEPERLFIGFWRIPGLDYAKQVGIPCVSFFRTNFLEYADDYFSLPVPLLESLKFIFKKFLSWVYNAYDVTLIHNTITQKKLLKIGINNTLYENLTGFDAAKFHPNLREGNFFEKKYGLPTVDRQVKLIFLGRLTPDKGWRFTINAFSRVAQVVNIENVALIIVGDGPMRAEIAQGFSNID